MSNITPGYTFTSATDPITFTKLNLLGSPTVTIGTGEVVTANIANNITITGLTLGSTLKGSVQSLSGPGAVDVVTTTTRLTTTGADALTLADGTNGQYKTIIMVVDGGNGTLTPTTKTGFSTITFTAVGNAVQLQFLSTYGWMITSNYGCTVA